MRLASFEIWNLPTESYRTTETSYDATNCLSSPSTTYEESIMSDDDSSTSSAESVVEEKAEEEITDLSNS